MTRASGQIRERSFNSITERPSSSGLSLWIGEERIGKRQPLIQHEPIAPADHSKQPDEFGGRLRNRHHVCRVVNGLYALQHSRRETPQRPLWIILLLEGTIDSVRNKKT